MNVAVLIEILVAKNCPREEAALRLVATAAQITGARPRVMLVEVEDLAEARRKGFTGSPTIRVNGQDIAPPSHGSTSLDCRDYPTDHGPSNIPPLPRLIAALTDAPAPF